MDKPQYVYATEMVTTPEKLWAALTSNKFWQEFSGPIASDWKVGSPIQYFLPDGTLYALGVVLQSDSPRLLSHTWPDPEGEQSADGVQCLTWRIESCSPSKVRLSLIHENLTDKVLAGVRSGWPVILKHLQDSLEIHDQP